MILTPKKRLKIGMDPSLRSGAYIPPSPKRLNTWKEPILFRSGALNQTPKATETVTGDSLPHLEGMSALDLDPERPNNTPNSDRDSIRLIHTCTGYLHIHRLHIHRPPSHTYLYTHTCTHIFRPGHNSDLDPERPNNTPNSD